MHENHKLQDHLDDFNKLCLDLENIDVKYEKKDKALVLPYSLPKSYENFVDILQHGRDKLSLEDVIGALNSKDLRIKMDSKSSPANALTARSRNPKKDSKNKGKLRSKSKNGKGLIKCYYCQQEGHIKRHCPKRKKVYAEKEKSDCGVNVWDADYDSADALTVSDNYDSQDWVLDSGYSFHMTPRKQWIQNFKEINGGKVLLGNDFECKVQGVGDVKLKMHDGTFRTLTVVRYVPELKRNLVSLRELDRCEYKYKGEGGVIKIHKGSLICMKAVLRNGIYFLQATTLKW